MSNVADKIRNHNLWRRGERDNMCNPTELGKDLDAITYEHDKLTEQNKLLREALMAISILPEVRMDEGASVARKALEATK